MLTNVHVKNLALIEETEINLTQGLNILTGETGAGKSIIIGSINYCLGQKADKDVIREGADYALVELVFTVQNPDDVAIIKGMDMEVEEDGTLILSRKIMPQRSVFKVCGETVTAKQMKDIARMLIDIHGQHEHQSLLQEKKQALILDGFAGEELASIKMKIADLYKEYQAVKAELDSFNIDEAEREREIALARYEIDEIEAANLKPGEEEELNSRFKQMLNSRKIVEALSKSCNYLNGQDSNALNLVGYAAGELSSVRQYLEGSEDGNDLASRLLDIESQLGDLVRDAEASMEELDYSEEEFAGTEERLNIINHLTMKYGASLEKVNEYLIERQKQLDDLLAIDDTKDRLNKCLSELDKKILELCEQAHKLREVEAKRLSKEIILVLQDLNFLKVDFAIEVNIRDSYNSDGYDDIAFMISLNPGEKLKPLSQVASGGELSRIMLALKTVFADKDSIDTLIFDEIDTGISGKTAWMVSERMGIISANHQVICITHLPQIAAMADTHFVITKAEKSGKTVTSINEIDEADRVEELSRMLGSDNITDAVRANAQELIDNAIKVKKDR